MNHLSPSLKLDQDICHLAKYLKTKCQNVLKTYFCVWEVTEKKLVR